MPTSYDLSQCSGVLFSTWFWIFLPKLLSNESNKAVEGKDSNDTVYAKARIQNLTF